ncbi:MAG: zinc-binding dehydrogenase [Panacagrimonas sp.]
MPNALHRTTLEVRSLLKGSGQLELSLVEAPVPSPKPHEVVVRVHAAPLNPSDLGLLLATQDFSGAELTAESAGRPVVSVPVSPGVLKALATRVDRSMAVGNEGAGEVVAAGDSPAAQALLGRTVGMIGGAMYTQYRCLPVEQCLVLPEGVTPREGASAFVNPLTALGMVETLRLEGHRALVHTAAASNLGQMLNRICREDGVELVNIVRRPEQAQLLREQLGARHVCDSSAPGFLSDLTAALTATGATLAFDAIGGGRLPGQILACMEAAVTANVTEYSRYGSSVHKQVYIYGSLDRSPTEIVRSFGLTWGLGGWLLFNFMQRVGPERLAELKARVAAGIRTTFASQYTRVVGLQDMLRPETIVDYARQATGTKYLLDPQL